MFKKVYTLSIAVLMVLVLFSGCTIAKKTAKKDVIKETETVTGSVEVNIENITEAPKVGELVKIPVYINTHTDNVTSLQLLFNYNQDLLELDSVSTLASKFTVWIKKDGGTGQVNLVAAEPKPGIIGSNELVATMIFKAKAAGETYIALDQTMSKMFTPDDMNVIRNDVNKNVHILITDK